MFPEGYLADLYVRTTRRTSKVEEQADGFCIGTLFQSDATPSECHRLSTDNVIAFLDEEVRITGIC